jgi:hypothetical protein
MERASRELYEFPGVLGSLKFEVRSTDGAFWGGILSGIARVRAWWGFLTKKALPRRLRRGLSAAEAQGAHSPPWGYLGPPCDKLLR